MNRFIQYFIKNKRLNYVLLIFLAYLGTDAYMNIPKEMFPDMELEKISVKGSYSGASAITMDKMAVRDIEDALNNISDIDKIDTTITPGKFTMVLTINENGDRMDILTKVKDSVGQTRQYLPSDMNEPIAKLLTKSKSLIKLSVSSKTLSRDTLTKVSQDIKSKLSKVKFISDISIRGDSREEMLISLNSQAISAYNLNHSEVVDAISNLSYIFPIGEIKERGAYSYVSSVNGKSNIKEWEQSILRVGNKNIVLGEIATLKIYHPQTSTLSTFNTNTTLTLVISKGEFGDSSKIVQSLKDRIKTIEKNYDGVLFDFYQDSSIPMQKRLDTVISNLTFGLILVFFSMLILINFRIAFIVTVGIPFSFIIGLLFIYYMGYSINIISLLGALIVIGIVVDDAIVVSENIQRYIDEGMAITEASMQGVKEMVLPITLATLTTVFAFLPILMMHGEIALFLVLIPVVVIMILLGSLIESFLFLPLHAEEFLKKSNNFIDWTPFQNLYERVLRTLIRYKKTSLLIFIIIIPLLTFVTAKSMKFQFFPNFDGSNLYISAKLDINTPIEDTFEIAREVELEMLKHKDEFSIKTTSSTAGYRRSLSGSTELSNNVFFITLELEDRELSNWVDKYVNPVLNFSFDFDHSDASRVEKTFVLAPKAQDIIQHFKEKYNMVELGILEDKTGLIKSDIKINLSGSNDAELESAIKKLSDKISTLKGIANYSDNIRYGKVEYKLKVTPYAEELGISEGYISKTLSSYFLEKKIATTFNDRGVMEIKVADSQKDETQTLLNFNITLKDGRYVKLSELVDIVEILDYEKIDKRDGAIVKTLFAKVDKRVVTPTEILDQLEDVLQQIEDDGIEINLLGEKEKKQQLVADMKNSSVLATFLIFLTLLLIFSKLKYAFMVISVIPLSVLGALVGHKLLGMNLSMPSFIGILGLAGVVINDGIIMLDFLHGTRNPEEFYKRAKLRLRPIVITSTTTFLGLATLMFYASGQAVILQPIAISIGFGLIWGTFLNLIYLPTLYGVVNKIK